MSKTIDQKVVELRFNNQQFEQETKKTMSTLDKLKAKLSFKGASDGLEQINKSAKKVSMDGLVSGVETVSARFSAMDIIATTALVNITNSAINAGKRMVASISTDQIAAGWDKMKQQMGSMQTLMNSTGKELDEIEGYLDDLMWYSDETSYSFTDMTTALANMTATGGDIEKLVPMIMGMANATAFAGKGAAEFSRVIYNLNQSYGAGALNLMDWKSVQLAGANSKQLTESLIHWGEELGTLKKGQVTIGNFNESLKDKWATTEVMEKAFGEFADFTLKVKEAVDAGEYATASKAIEELSKNYEGISAKAFKAAQEAKSFTEAVDATKDAVSSGWMRIFKTIFGNFDEQRILWTDLANSLWEIFAAPIEKLEGFLKQALGFNAVKSMWDKINNNPIIDALKEVDGAIKKSSKSLEEYQAIITKVWRGDFNNRGDNPDRFDLLSQAGWDPRVVQSLVNQTDQMAGYGKGWTVIDKLTIEDVTEAEKKYGIAVEQSTEAIKQEQKQVAKFTDEYLREQLKLTDDQIALYRDLEAASKKYGISMDEIIAKMEKTNGREHLEGSWREIGTIIKETLGAIGIALGEVFHFNPINLYLALEKLHNKLTKVRELLIGVYEEEIDENGEKTGEMVLKRSKHYQNLIDTLKGFFSIVKLITTIVGSGLRIGIAIVNTVLKTFGLTILDVTAAIGNVVTALVEWIEDNNFILKGIEWLITTIIGGINWLWDWADAHWGIAAAVRAIIDVLKKGKSGIVSWIEGLMTTDDVGKYLLDTLGKFPKKLKEVWNAFQQTKVGQVVMSWWEAIKNSDFGRTIAGWINNIKNTDFVKKLADYFNSFDGGSVGMNIVLGIWNGIKTYGGKAIEGIKTLGTWLLTAIKNVLGIHSPSTEFFSVGQNIVQGLFNGIGSLVGMVYNLISTLGSKTIEIIKDLDIGSVFVALVSAGAIFGIIQFAKAIGKLADILESFDRLVDQARQTMKAFEGVLKAFKVKIITSAIKDVAVSIAILAGSIWLLSTIEAGDLQKAGLAMLAMVVMIGALVAVAGKFGKAQALEFGKLALTILAVGAAMLLMAMAFKKIANIKEISWQALTAFGMMIVALIAIAFVAGRAEKQLLNLGGTLLAVGAGLYLMSMVVKKLGKMDPAQLEQGLNAIKTFGLLIIGFMAATKLLTGSTNVAKFGPMMLQIGVAFYLMGMVVKKLGKMDRGQLIQGTVALAAFGGMIVGLMAATRLLTGSKNVAAIGATLMAVGGAIALMAISVRLLGNMDAGALVKGTIVVGAFMGMIIGLIYAIKKIGGKDIDNINKTLLSVAAMIAVMTLSVALLGMMDVAHLAKGLIAVGFMTLFISGMIYATKNAKNLGKTLWPLVAAIGVMALAIGLLSIIDPKRLIAPTLALGGLMLIFGLMAKLSKNIGASGKGVLINLGVMIGVVVVLSIILAKLSQLNPGNVLSSAVSIGVLLLAIVGSLMILSKMQINPKDLLGPLLGMALIIGMLYLLVGVIKGLSGIENAETILLSLSVFMGMMTLMLLGLAVAAAIYTATGGVGLLLALGGLLGIIGALYLLVGVVKGLSGIENVGNVILLLTGLLGVLAGMLIILGTVGILALAGVAAIYGLLAIMPPLLLFCTGLGALVTYLPMLEEFMNKGLSILITLAGGLGEMLGAFIGGALTQLSAGLPEIGTNLSLFMINATPFILGMKLVDGQTLKGIGILTAAIIALSAAQLINGITSFLTFGGSFATLGTQLSQFAMNALPFMMIMSTIPAAAMQGVSALAGAVLSLTAANLLDGLTRFIGMGGSSLASFGEQLPPLGTALSSFVSNLGTFGDDQIKTAECAGNAIVAIADAASKLPKEGGWAQAIFGETNLAKFAEQMPVVAGGVVSFIETLGVFGDPEIKTAECACKVITSIAEAAQKLPKEGGFWQKLFGSEGDGLTKFAGNMPKVGEGVRGFINELDSVKDKVGVADAGAKIIESIAKLSDLDLDKAGEKLPGFGDKMKEFGTKLKDFINNFKSVSTEDVETVNGNLVVVTEAVKKLMITINDTANANSDSVITTVEDIGKKAAKALGSESVLSELQAQGKNFVTGFSTAITNNSSLAETASRKMTEKAMQAIKDTQNSNSPAKETIKLGDDFGDGYIMAIGSYASKAYSVSSEVGEEAKKGLSSSVLKMSNLVDADMDMNPVIKPVLDLSDVTDGAGQIKSMFNNPSLQVASHLNSISSGMKNRNQNGNSEVVSAIDKLGKNLGGSGDTYNINGVTYGDDSAIGEAIGVLLRAANVERRT